jgi:serine phosphatase RsbU (regulator of sigma subunit)
MKLQQKIARGMLVLFFVVVVFIVLTSKNYNDIEGFVIKDMPHNFKVAREYERFAEYWSQIGESKKDYVKFSVTDKNISVEVVTEQLLGYLDRIETLVINTEEHQVYSEIKLKCLDYTHSLKQLELLVEKKNRLLKRFTDKKKEAIDNTRSEIMRLLDQFKEMTRSWRVSFEAEDFKESLSQTSGLIEYISRIEKDLIVVSSEMSNYLLLKNEQENGETIEGKNSVTANGVERRLRSILALISRAMKQSKLPVQKRVFSQIDAKIKSFYEAFVRLRTIIEVPEYEYIETEDQINKILEETTQSRQLTVALAHSRSEKYWRNIFAISDDLIDKATYNYHMILSFLGLILVISVYLFYEFPKSVSHPLENLNQSVSAFQLGKNSFNSQESGIMEIDELSMAFNSMVARLNIQGEINRKYLESIHSLTNIYRDLHEVQDRYDYPFERIENAITLVLQQLFEHCPKIDLLKAMVIYEEPGTGKKYFMRIGRPEYSEAFKQSEEAKAYFSSVGFDMDNPDSSASEIIPIDKGLTGYYFEQFNDIKLAADSGPEFFIESYPLLPIPRSYLAPRLKSGENAEITYEDGLNGSLLTEKLKIPDKDPAIIQNARGLLFVYFMGEDVKLSWQEIFFIQIIASQIASIIETDALLLEHDQKKLIDDQLNMAKEIQENLLPQRVPILDKLKISKINQPAAEVGGDYYDFFILPDGKIRIVIADASGKNIPAAIIMTVFKTTLSTMDLENLSAPEVLTRANKIISKNITTDRFITAMYVVVDPETGNVELSSAGHNPAFVVPCQGNAIHSKNVKGLPLGIIDDYEYGSINFKLEKNDLLWMYTDGVTEARNVNDEEYGEKRLKRFLVNYKGDAPTKDLLAKLQEFSKLARQHDDITAVSVKYIG